MWLADTADPTAIAGANLWWFLGSTAVALISAAVTIYTIRTRPKEDAGPSRAEVAKALDAQERMIMRLIVKPLQTERDEYRERWTACERGDRRERHAADPPP